MTVVMLLVWKYRESCTIHNGEWNVAHTAESPKTSPISPHDGWVNPAVFNDVAPPNGGSSVTNIKFAPRAIMNDVYVSPFHELTGTDNGLVLPHLGQLALSRTANN